MARIGLRIDVDTYRGTRDGVPELLRALSDFSVAASFFFSVGPDNMGRHLRRLIKPAFFWKMLRSNAASLYGWDILLCGVFFPGPLIGAKLGDVIRSASDSGHEIGLHAWDHHAWQARIKGMDFGSIKDSLLRGVDMLAGIIGRLPDCSASPGWRCTEQALLAKQEFPFAYNSDCRGNTVFAPVVAGAPLSQPQVPTTMPTYDELIGSAGINDENYNQHLLKTLQPDRLNVLTIHAEVEGIARSSLFRNFLELASAAGHEFVPLGLLIGDRSKLASGLLGQGTVPGREGWLAVQRPSP